MKLLSVIIITFIALESSRASDPVVALEQGDKAPFKGFLFSPAREKELRLLDVSLGYYKDLSNSLMIINKAQEDSLNKFEARLEKKDQRIDQLSNRDNSFFEKAGYFLLGAVITGVISYGTVQSLGR